MLETLTVIAAIACWALAYKRPWIGLLVSPLGCICVSAIGVAEESVPILVLGPGVIVGVAIAIMVASRNPLSDPRPRQWARLVLWGVLILLATVPVSLVCGFWASPLFLVFGLYIVCVFVSAYEARGLTASVIISTLGAAMRQNLPLPMALESAAFGREDTAGYVMRQISRWLVQGYSLGEAVRRGYPQCPGQAYGMIVAAERMGQLPTALEVIERDMHASAARRNLVNPIYPFYPIALSVAIILLVSGLMKFVIPQFRSVLQEMVGGDLPLATRVLLGVYRHVGDWLWLVVIAVLLMVGITAIIRWWRPRRPERPGPLSTMGDLIRWHLPILHWFERNRSMVQTIDGLRMAFAVGHTVDQAVANTLVLDTNVCFKRRLRRWLAAIQQGQDAARAATQSGLAPALAWAFDTRVNQGNTPAILEMIESFHRSNYSYRVNLARLLLWPCVTVAMACIVAFVAYAIFSPMVALIYSLAGYIP